MIRKRGTKQKGLYEQETERLERHAQIAKIEVNRTTSRLIGILRELQENDYCPPGADMRLQELSQLFEEYADHICKRAALQAQLVVRAQTKLPYHN